MEENKLIRNQKDKTLMIIIGVLAIIVIALFVFFMIEKSENKQYIAEIRLEKEQLELELGELSHNYDTLKTSNDTLSQRLLGEQEKIAILLEKMQTFRDNSYAEISKYKKEVGTLKTILRSYIVQIDSLNQLNAKLFAENTQTKQQIEFVRNQNEKLSKEVRNQQEALERAGALETENFTVFPINKRGKETNLAKCFQLQASFVITKNITAKRGDRVVYLRIKRPDDKVIAFSEKSFFKYQNASLTYTAKREFVYEGERLEMSIFWPNDGSLIKGQYTAELFSDNELIGTTEFFLKK